jgi:hypothetical protein
MSEHNRGLDAARVAQIVAECDALSDAEFLVVPGFECEATPDYVHILGYDLRALVRGRDAAEICHELMAANAFAVVAHPLHRGGFAHLCPEALDLADGWEIWNGKADGRWFPSVESARRLAGLRADHARLLPLGGADLHRLESYPGIELQVECGGRSAGDVIAALRRRAYRIAGPAFGFAASDDLQLPRFAMAAMLGAVLPRVKRAASRLDRWAAGRGAAMPASFYRWTRRILR